MRNLKPIEIAEGALLADIAVIFQLLTVYLPVGGNFFRLLTFPIFAILVLRRGLYAGIIGMCVAFFIVSIVIGPQNVALMFLECVGGLFLGVTMKHRLQHLPLLLLGITCGALTLYGLLILLLSLVGISIANLVHGFHQPYQIIIHIIDLMAPKIGLATIWKQSIYPEVVSLSKLALTYLWITLYLLLWIVLCPVVTAVYAVTNLFVRLLGYDVRPFPGGKIGRVVHWLTRRIVKIAVKRGIIKRYEH